MRGVFLALLASIVFTTACDRYVQLSQPAVATESAEACPALAAATSAQVLVPPGSAPPGKGAYGVTDAAALSRLVAFIKLRRDVSPPSADTSPIPRTRVMLASGSSRAVFGSGLGVFYFQCGTVKGTRYASAAELAEFEFLIAPPNAAQ